MAAGPQGAPARLVRLGAERSARIPLSHATPVRELEDALRHAFGLAADLEIVGLSDGSTSLVGLESAHAHPQHAWLIVRGREGGAAGSGASSPRAHQPARTPSSPGGAGAVVSSWLSQLTQHGPLAAGAAARRYGTLVEDEEAPSPARRGASVSPTRAARRAAASPSAPSSPLSTAGWPPRRWPAQPAARSQPRTPPPRLPQPPPQQPWPPRSPVRLELEVQVMAAERELGARSLLTPTSPALGDGAGDGSAAIERRPAGGSHALGGGSRKDSADLEAGGCSMAAAAGGGGVHAGAPSSPPRADAPSPRREPRRWRRWSTPGNRRAPSAGASEVSTPASSSCARRAAAEALDAPRASTAPSLAALISLPSAAAGELAISRRGTEIAISRRGTEIAISALELAGCPAPDGAAAAARSAGRSRWAGEAAAPGADAADGGFERSFLSARSRSSWGGGGVGGGGVGGGGGSGGGGGGGGGDAVASSKEFPQWPAAGARLQLGPLQWRVLVLCCAAAVAHATATFASSFVALSATQPAEGVMAARGQPWDIEKRSAGLLAGECLGLLLGGALADGALGRRAVGVWAAWAIAVLGVATAVSPRRPAAILLAVRTLAAAACGGLGTLFVLLAEALPPPRRGRVMGWVAVVSALTALGTGAAVPPTVLALGWRSAALGAALPALVLLIGAPLLPESLPWLAARGDAAAVRVCVAHAAAENAVLCVLHQRQLAAAAAAAVRSSAQRSTAAASELLPLTGAADAADAAEAGECREENARGGARGWAAPAAGGGADAAAADACAGLKSAGPSAPRAGAAAAPHYDSLAAGGIGAGSCAGSFVVAATAARSAEATAAATAGAQRALASVGRMREARRRSRAQARAGARGAGGEDDNARDSGRPGSSCSTGVGHVSSEYLPPQSTRVAPRGSAAARSGARDAAARPPSAGGGLLGGRAAAALMDGAALGGAALLPDSAAARWGGAEPACGGAVCQQGGAGAACYFGASESYGVASSGVAPPDSEEGAGGAERTDGAADPSLSHYAAAAASEAVAEAAVAAAAAAAAAARDARFLPLLPRAALLLALWALSVGAGRYASLCAAPFAFASGVTAESGLFDYGVANVSAALALDAAGALCAATALDALGRRATQACLFALSAAAHAVVGLCAALPARPAWALALVYALARASHAGGSAAAWCACFELWPTRVRATAVAAAACAARAGALGALAWAAHMRDTNAEWAHALAAAAAAAVGAAVALALPETAGTDLAHAADAAEERQARAAAWRRVSRLARLYCRW